MSRSRKDKEVAIEEPSPMEVFHENLESYKEAFLSANYKLEKSKLEGLEITSALIDEIFNEPLLLRQALFIYIDSLSRSDKQIIADEAIKIYNDSVGLPKRALVDVRAYLLNQGIC